MVKNPNDTSIAIKKSTMARLNKLKHQGQKYDGFINELLDDQTTRLHISQTTMARLEDYRQSPNESIDDLIIAVLDELENNIKNIASK